MIAGHAALGFLVAALIGYWSGVEPDQCIKLGLFASMFAALPDIDVIFASGEIFSILTAGLGGFVESFWAATSAFHRGITHSLVTLGLASAAFIGYRRWNDLRLAAAIVLFSTAYGLFLGGIEAAMVMAVFMPTGLLLSSVSRNYLDREQFTVAAVSGLMLHPLGDIFTGTPPSFLFPLDITILNSRIVLNQDPVLNLLAILFLELLLVLVAVLVAILLKDDDLRQHISPAPLIGILYIPLYFVIPEPTLSTSYSFVFAAVGLGFLATFIAHRLNGLDLDGHLANMHGLNFVLTLIVSSICYTAVYLLL